MGTGKRFSGVVTLVFTDIEGSTALLTALGDAAYADALAEHRRVVREVFAEHGGVEVDTQGDAFFYVFRDPGEAVTAAAKVQVELEPGPVRVRVGVHTGEVLATDEGYTGREVHRGARIAAAGHGGQVLVSAATQRLLGAAGHELGLTGLGEHRVKDFEDPIGIFQLGGTSFPPLRTISNTNLPAPPSPFVGRLRERDEVTTLLRDGARMVTLTGPGGTGKTRLAIEAAGELLSDFPAGVFWVPVATLRDPSLVLEAVARSVGGDDAAAEIADRHLLLVVDNLEQVIDAAPDLTRLVGQCPHLQVLVTSREVMRVPGETEYPVPPLTEADAVDLFRSLTRLPDDPATTATLAELCRRLDQMPLALEMAAARTAIMTPDQILDRLGQRLDLLKSGRGVDPRQQTLRTTIEWSHDLLTDTEQQVFARLAVFRGGATLEAAEQVAGADVDVLQSLTDKSLLRYADGRFTMLETIRAYGWEQLEVSGDLDDVRRSHAAWQVRHGEHALELAESGAVDSSLVFQQLRDEHENLRSACEWARDARADETLLRLAAVGVEYWDGREAHEAESWLTLALERSETPVLARITVLRGLSTVLAVVRHDFARSDALIDEWLRTAERHGDEHGALRALNSLAVNQWEQGHLAEAQAGFLEIRERAEAAGFTDLAAFAAVNLSSVALVSGDASAGLRYSLEGIEPFRRAKDNAGEAACWDNAGWCALVLGDARAASYFATALPFFVALRADRGLFKALCGIGISLARLGAPEVSARLWGGAEPLLEGLPNRFDDSIQEGLYDDAVAAGRAARGDEAFDREWALGASSTLDEVVALAEREAQRLAEPA